MPSNESMQLRPVGVVKSELKTPVLRAHDSGIALTERMEKMRAHHKEIQENISELHIFPDWEELLEGIEDFSHIMVLYWPHLIEPERRQLKQVHPMGRKDLPIKGIFATRSPARPNPVLVTVVRLLERSGAVLKVQGLEAVDGSPVVDIKPHMRSYWSEDNLVLPAWMEQIEQELKGPEPETDA